MNKNIIYLIGALVGVAAVTLLMTQNSNTTVVANPTASPANGLMSATTASATATATDAALSAAGVTATPTAIAPGFAAPAQDNTAFAPPATTAPADGSGLMAIPPAAQGGVAPAVPGASPDTTDMPEDSGMPDTDPAMTPGSSDELPSDAEVAPQPTAPDAVTTPVPGAVDEKPITPSEGQ